MNHKHYFSTNISIKCIVLSITLMSLRKFRNQTSQARPTGSNKLFLLKTF